MDVIDYVGVRTCFLEEKYENYFTDILSSSLFALSSMMYLSIFLVFNDESLLPFGTNVC